DREDEDEVEEELERRHASDGWALDVGDQSSVWLERLRKKPCPLRFVQRSPAADERQVKPARDHVCASASAGVGGWTAVSPTQMRRALPVACIVKAWPQSCSQKRGRGGGWFDISLTSQRSVSAYSRQPMFLLGRWKPGIDAGVAAGTC